MLVLLTRDVRVLQELHIEADQFLAECPDAAEPLQPPHPGEHIGKPTFQRRWQPPCRSPSVEKSRGAVAGMSASAGPAAGAVVVQALGDLLSPMGELPRPDHLAGGVVDQRQTGGLRPRINLEPQRFRRRCLHTLVLEDDGKRVPAPHGSVTR
jgi:hypothetical protein